MAILVRIELANIGKYTYIDGNCVSASGRKQTLANLALSVRYTPESSRSHDSL
jgi:hypothetical protein